MAPAVADQHTRRRTKETITGQHVSAPSTAERVRERERESRERESSTDQRTDRTAPNARSRGGKTTIGDRRGTLAGDKSSARLVNRLRNALSKERLISVPREIECRPPGTFLYFLGNCEARLAGVCTTHTRSSGPARMRRDLRGAVALVTGASRGIGKATALALARDGCSLILAGRDRSGTVLREVATECEAAGAPDTYKARIHLLALSLNSIHSLLCLSCLTVRQVMCDLASDAGISRLCSAVESVGRLDILIHNAGYCKRSAVADMTPELYDAMTNLNMRAPALITARLLPLVRRSSRGAVIFLSSSECARAWVYVLQSPCLLSRPSSRAVGGVRGGAGVSCYCATKHSINGFADSLYQEEVGRQPRLALSTPCPTRRSMGVLSALTSTPCTWSPSCPGLWPAT
jgi:NAD(P)-dependent dehydrogenase (short-subunit alcohol dehydrogenase family)